MTGDGAARRMRHHLLFGLLCAALIFARLLPLDPAATRWPGPDLMLCLALAWAARRPGDVPVWLLAPLFLTADLLLTRPPGLWTALVLLAVETLRAAPRGRATTFPAEWLRAAALLAGVSLAHWLVLTVLLVDQPPFWQQGRMVLSGVAAYPAVAAVLHWGLRIRRRPVPEGFGRRSWA